MLIVPLCEINLVSYNQSFCVIEKWNPPLPYLNHTKTLLQIDLIEGHQTQAKLFDQPCLSITRKHCSAVKCYGKLVIAIMRKCWQLLSS